MSEETLLTVPQVAERAGVSERTVRRAISAGVLPVVRRNQRALHITLADAQRYRPQPVDAVSPKEAAYLCGVHVRTIWNWIAKGHLAAHGTSPRRTYLSRKELLRAVRNYQLLPHTARLHVDK